MDSAGALQALQRFIAEGGSDPAVLEQIVAAAAGDPDLMQSIGAILEQAGANQGIDVPLDIEALYPGGEGQYALRWPLAAPSGLPAPFDQLDRKTQFFVLVNEWSYRNMQGWSALNSGAVDIADSIFSECAERALQLDCAELEARSYEGRKAAAEKRGRPDKALEWSTEANAARTRR